VKTLLRIPRLEAGRCGVAGGDEKKRQRSAGVGKGMKLTGGPHMSGDVRERRRLCWSAQCRIEYAFQKIRQRGLG
jgi:hypothetical protein